MGRLNSGSLAGPGHLVCTPGKDVLCFDHKQACIAEGGADCGSYCRRSDRYGPNGQSVAWKQESDQVECGSDESSGSGEVNVSLSTSVSLTYRPKTIVTVAPGNFLMI